MFASSQPLEFPKLNLKLVLTLSKQEETKKEAARARWVGGRFNQQGNLVRRVLGAHKTDACTLTLESSQFTHRTSLGSVTMLSRWSQHHLPLSRLHPGNGSCCGDAEQKLWRFQGKGRAWGAPSCPGPVWGSTAGHILLMTYSNSVPQWSELIGSLPNMCPFSDLDLREFEEWLCFS